MCKYLQLIILLFCANLHSQENSIEKLQASVLENNRRGNFNKSMEQINTFISDNESDNFFLYKAYILKSYTHKGLFDYEATFKALDKAYVFGNKTKNKEEVIANVNLEKAYAYFDVAKYKEAKVMMLHLKKTNYMHIHSADIAGMLMQEAYLEYLDKNYSKAEKIYDEAIILMSKANPKNLPIIYGKKVQLYTHTKENEKLNNAFQLGLKSAKENKIIKYEVYMHEQMREKQMQNGNWKAAFYSYKKIDSLLTIYNANDKNEQLKLLEKDLEIQKKDNAIKWNKIQRNVLLIFLFVCFIAIYFGIKNHKSKLENHKLLEKENKRIHDELQLLSSNLVSQGFKEIDFSKYGLSERQLQIIELISQGKTNKEIANQIFISENTVKYHLKTIYDIMGIENRNEFFKMIKS